MRALSCFIVNVFVSYVALASVAYNVTFDSTRDYPSGIPEGWEFSGSGKVSLDGAKIIASEYGLRFNFISATGENIVKTKEDVLINDNNQISCDYVSASVRIYMQKTANKNRRPSIKAGG